MLPSFLPKDWKAAALVGRILRPGLGASVVRVNGDGTATDITVAFPTVSKLCGEPDPAASLRSVAGENLGELAALVPQLLAPIDLQAVKAAGVTFPVSMIERMIEEALRGDPANTKKREEIVGRIQEFVGSLSDVTPASPEALKLLAYLTDPNGLKLSPTYPQVGLGEKAEIFTKQAVPLGSLGYGAEAGFNEESPWTNPEPELVSVINSSGRIVGASLGNDVNDRYLEGLSALLLGVAKDRRGSTAIGPFVRLFDGNFTLDTIRNMKVHLEVTGLDGFQESGVNSMAEIKRDPQDVLARQAFEINDYPDGMVLFNGTGIVPNKDRKGPGSGSGFFHKRGDVVRIFSDELGCLMNTMVPTQDVQVHGHSMFDFIRDLARRGIW
jgi:fumarylacetoacetate (FAA) hydrolase family protein